MLIRADIDTKDLADVRRDTRKWLNRESVTLCLTVTLLAAIMTSAGVGLYSSMQAIIAAAARGVDPASLYQQEQAQLLQVLLNSILMLACAVTAFGVFRARRMLAKDRKHESVKDGLSVGRFDYIFSDKHLIIKGPLKTKKIAWTHFTRMEDAKSSILFWRDDGGFEFLPKNVLPDNVTFEQLGTEFLPRIEQALPFEDALYAKRLAVTFEALKSDRNEYDDYYYKRRDGLLHFARRLLLWAPLPSFLFLSFALIAGDAFRGAMRSGDLSMAAIGAVFITLAAALFAVKSENFLGAAQPFRKDGVWPFAQSNLTSVALSKEAVFWRARGVQQIIPWDGFNAVVECPLTAYLVITPGQVIALPKRAFISAKHYHSFVGYANSRIASARRAREERKRQRLTNSFGKSAKTAPSAPARPRGEVEAFPAAAPEPAPEKRRAESVQNTVVRLRAG